jgi:hypothetical protein
MDKKKLTRTLGSEYLSAPEGSAARVFGRSRRPPSRSPSSKLSARRRRKELDGDADPRRQAE